MKRKLMILTMATLLVLACGGKKEERSPAPYFSLTNLSGQKVTRDDFKGKPFILVFWATWCPTCKKEIPTLNRLAEEGYTVVAVALDKDRDKVSRFVKEHHIRYTVLLGNYQVTIDYGNIRFLPTIFLIDPQGYIVGRMVGGIDEKKVENFFRGTANK